VKPWFALNCAAIAADPGRADAVRLTKGAFTGATQNKSGYFEECE